MTANSEQKLTILNAICEHPGWQPQQPVASSTERALNELHLEGWIVARLDGWEATAEALECFPNFYLDDEGRLRGERAITPPKAADATTTGEPAVTKSRSKLVAVLTMWDHGVEIRERDGRFSATFVRPGGSIAAFGHTDCLRMMGRMAELLPPDARP